MLMDNGMMLSVQRDLIFSVKDVEVSNTAFNHFVVIERSCHLNNAMVVSLADCYSRDLA